MGLIHQTLLSGSFFLSKKEMCVVCNTAQSLRSLLATKTPKVGIFMLARSFSWICRFTSNWLLQEIVLDLFCLGVVAPTVFFLFCDSRDRTYAGSVIIQELRASLYPGQYSTVPFKSDTGAVPRWKLKLPPGVEILPCQEVTRDHIRIR